MAKRPTAPVSTTEGGQTVRFPKELRVDMDTVILDPTREWPEGYLESFAGLPDDFERPAQDEVEKRRKL